MYETTVRYLGDDEQNKWWLDDIINYRHQGCYGQTEFGHGSNVRGLETTATYDPTTEEFVLNSPTITSGKAWPGEMGHTATHGVFHCRLISKGKDYGVQTFFAQIRDPQTMKTLEGIEAGELGPKYGYEPKDNGFLFFKNYRIPRRHLLSRYVTLSKEGDFSTQGEPRVAYAIMMFIRQWLLVVSYDALAKSCTIAIRYNIVRTQFKTLPK